MYPHVYLVAGNIPSPHQSPSTCLVCETVEVCVCECVYLSPVPMDRLFRRRPVKVSPPFDGVPTNGLRAGVLLTSVSVEVAANHPDPCRSDGNTPRCFDRPRRRDILCCSGENQIIQ
jgi:hypothetical protein